MAFLLLILSGILTIDIPVGWQTDFELAKALAHKENKTILMVFSGSDWCAPCKKLKKEVLTKELFSDYSKEHLVLLYLDFPSKRKNRLSKEQTMHNENLAALYNQSGRFPMIVLLDYNGKVVKEIKYEGQGVEEFVETISKVI